MNFKLCWVIIYKYFYILYFFERLKHEDVGYSVKYTVLLLELKLST